MHTYKKFLIIFIFTFGILLARNASATAPDAFISAGSSGTGTNVQITIPSGSRTTISWGTNNGTNCAADDTDHSSPEAISLYNAFSAVVGNLWAGSYLTPYLTSTAYYSVHCYNYYNEKSAIVTATILIGTNGSCSSTPYGCSAGTSANNAESTTSWTWTCVGLGAGTNASCSQTKPTGTLTAANCTIPDGSNSCNSTVNWTQTPNIASFATIYAESPNWTGLTSLSVPPPSSPDGSSGSFSASIPYNYEKFYLYALNGSTILSTTTVTANCASASSWSTSSNTCVPKPVLALSAYPATVYLPVGALAQSASTITTTAGSSVTGINYAQPMTDSDNGKCLLTTKLLDRSDGNKDLSIDTTKATNSDCKPGYVNVTATGNNGAVSSSTTVTVNIMSGTLTPNNSYCTISEGKSSCNVGLTWKVTNPTVPGPISAVTSSIKDDGTANNNTPVYYNDDADSRSVVVPYSNTLKPDVHGRDFYLYNNGYPLAQTSVTASCVSGLNWDGSKCALSVPVLPIPASPSIDATTGACGGKINLVWEAVSGAASYNVYRDNLSTKLAAAGNSAHDSSNPYVDTGLALGSNHTYGISASNTSGTSAVSWTNNGIMASGACTQLSGTLSADSPSSPLNSLLCIIPTGQSSCSVNLSWDTEFP